jgi:hypothetical protein
VAAHPVGQTRAISAVAREMPHVPLEDALKLVHLYAEKESPKYEKAAMKFLAALPGREGADAQELCEGRARARASRKKLAPNESTFDGASNSLDL